MSPDEFPGKPLSLAQACARLRFQHLQFLDILGRTRNLRLTAEQMHVTQPAATKILMDIEEVLEARLFDRLSRGMRPSELGLFTLRYASAAHRAALPPPMTSTSTTASPLMAGGPRRCAASGGMQKGVWGP